MAITNRQPIQWMRGNIFVTRTGAPYAVWMLAGRPYGEAATKEKIKVKEQHQNLFQALRGELTILGIVATMSPEVIMNKMLQDVEEPSEQWLRECALTNEELSVYPAGERAYFLIAPLVDLSWAQWRYKAITATEQWGREKLGLHRTPPSDAVLQRWISRMKAIGGRIPAAFDPSPAGISALRWIAHHQMTKGAEPSEPIPRGPLGEDLGGWVNVASVIPEPLIDEGGMSDYPDSKFPQAQAVRNRFVKVQTPTTEPSYQQYSALGLAPQAGFVFPGAEFINAAASMPEDVDYCLRMTITTAAKVKARNRRAERNLKDQARQRGSTGDSLTDEDADMDKSGSALRDYSKALNASDREVEVAASILFSTSGATAEEAQQQMKSLQDIYKENDWILDAPVAGQRALFWDCWPGSTVSSVSAAYSQITTGTNFAMGIPLSQDTIGATHGFRAGINITTGRPSPVFLSLGNMTMADMSGSYACVGELGCGKSFFQKTVAAHTIDRGGVFIGVDHSDNQEWVALAKSLTTANVIDFMDPSVSIDPIRLYGQTPKMIRPTQNFFEALMSYSPYGGDERKLLMNSVIKDISSGDLPEITSMRALYDYFNDGEELAENDRELGKKIARGMNSFINIDFAQTFFNTDLPVLKFDAQATVFATHGLELPEKEELESQITAVSDEKKMGSAIYAYLAHIAREIMFADDSQEVLFNVDEAHHMTNSPHGKTTVKEMLKVGRKHKGAVGLGTHAAAELGDSDLRGLIPLRFVFRHRDDDQARENLRWLSESYVQPEYLELVTKQLSPFGEDGQVPAHRRGECLFRDHLSRVGKMRTVGPLAENRRKTVSTTPPKVRQVAAA